MRKSLSWHVLSSVTHLWHWSGCQKRKENEQMEAIPRAENGGKKKKARVFHSVSRFVVSVLDFLLSPKLGGKKRRKWGRPLQDCSFIKSGDKSGLNATPDSAAFVRILFFSPLRESSEIWVWQLSSTRAIFHWDDWAFLLRVLNKLAFSSCCILHFLSYLLGQLVKELWDVFLPKTKRKASATFH